MDHVASIYHVMLRLMMRSQQKRFLPLHFASACPDIPSIGSPDLRRKGEKKEGKSSFFRWTSLKLGQHFRYHPGGQAVLCKFIYHIATLPSH
jgi:hypothetical protein